MLFFYILGVFGILLNIVVLFFVLGVLRDILDYFRRH